LAKNSSNLAIRLPKNDLLITILKKVNVPIVSTSLNISREKSINNLDNLEKYFKQEKPDLAVDAGKIINRPSKIINITDINNIKILRN